MLKKVIKKIFFSQSEVENKNLANYNVIKGSNTDIHPTSSLVTVGNGKIIFEGNNYVGKHVEIGTGGEIRIGKNTSIQNRCIFLEDIEIGRNCIFAHNVYISSGRHYYHLQPELYIKDQDKIVAQDEDLSASHSKKVIIEDDCWLGANVVVMSGIKIGRGCVIGANSVVTKDVEPFSVVAGIPAKLLKKRLELVPKKIIVFNNKIDLPNFYKGFLVDTESLNNFSSENGIACLSCFIVYMSDEGTEMIVTLKKNVSGKLVLNYNNQKKEISSNDYQEINFSLQKTNYHQFTVTTNEETKDELLIVSKIEIK